MWLLDTHTLKLHYFASPESVEEGYMILSHVWDESEELEMSFQDIQRIHERCAASGEDPHHLVNTKIRKCCELGEHHGYKWAWIDTCCIDKTSSAELMETINAMYQYYALSLVCYVYLPDFWRNKSSEYIRSRMRNSKNHELDFLVRTRWQRRGWTLQELIAPRVVHFLSSLWMILGTKNDLADYLEAGLGIPASVLRHEQSPSEFSVAQRMSWAAKRRTTRIEDEAYSLLGLFGINMPTLYGEGKKAFQRLQEEILKQTGDTTLFAWGEPTLLSNLRGDYPGHAQTGLLASAPSDFKSSRNLQTIPPLGSNHALCRRMRFRTTPYGPILARIPVLHLNGQAFGDLSWYQGEARILLVLTKCNRPTHLPYPIYDIGVDHASVTSETPPLRLVKIHNYQDNVSAMHTNSLRTIFLVRHRSEKGPDEPIMIYLPLNHGFPPSIRLPEHLFDSLLNHRAVTEVSITNAQLPWSGDPPFMTAFREQTQADILYATVLFALCTSHSTNGKETGSLWATFRGGLSTWERVGDYSHQCPADHVLNWPGLKRRFVVKFHANDEGMGDHIAKWMFDMEFAISEHTGALVLTKLTLGFRPLLREFGYRDRSKDEEEQMTQTRSSSISDLQSLKQSPVFTPGKELEEVAPTQEDRQNAIGACTRRRLFPAVLFELACTCYTELFTHRVRLSPSISASHQLASLPLHVYAPLRHWYSIASMSPPPLYWNGLGTEDLSLSLP